MNYYIITALLNFFATGSLAVIVLFSNIKNRMNQTYALTYLSIALWALFYFFWQTAASYSDAMLYLKLLMFAATFMPIFLFHFMLAYLNIERKHYWFLSALYLIGFIFILCIYNNLLFDTLTPKLGFPFWPNAGKVMNLYMAFFFGFILYAMFMLYKSFMSSFGSTKTRIIYLIVGLGFAILAGSPNYFLWYNIPIPPILNPLFIVSVAIIGYAILRHRLMDIQFIIKKGIVYSALVAVIIGLYSALLLVIQQLFQSTIGVNQWLATVITAICIAAGFRPLEIAFTNFTDKVFFKAKYNYQRTLAELSKGMAELTNLERLTKLVAKIVVRNMKLEGSMLFVYDYRDNNFNAVSAQGNMKSFRGMTLLKDDPLIKRLDQTEDVIIKEELVHEFEDKQLIVSFRGEIKDIIKQMANFKAVLCVPSKIKGKLIGFIMLSDKKSQDTYSTEDLMLFQTLAPQAAIAIKNAMTYDEIRKELEAHQRKLNETEINLSRSERIASMARLIQEYNHEIRTPLAIMSAKLLSLPDNPGDIADFKELKAFFEKQINRASDIVDTTLRLSQPKEHKEELLDLNSVIEDALKLYQPIGLNLIKELNPLPEIKGDRDDLKLVFINLLKNAREATPEKGDIKIRTYIEDENGEKYVIAKVSDHGIGIPKENMDKIFEPFFSTHTTKGRGLGLSLVFRIVREHHGKIEVESEVGKGSTFSVRIPIS